MLTTKEVFYNEIDQQKCAWLSHLMDAGLITPGVICDKSIENLNPDGLGRYRRAHFFAGVGVWDYALNLAGWRDDGGSLWTGSCPCPSFSAAGKGKGFEDPRHLWPAWYRLIRECRPATIFGEQVEAAIGYGWLDLVQAQLEAQAYAVGKAVLGACSVGAPHRRQRLYFVADSERNGRRSDLAGREAQGRATDGRDCEISNGVNAEINGRERQSLFANGEPSQRIEEGSRFSNGGNPAQRGLGMHGGASGNSGHVTQPDEIGDGGDSRRLRSRRPRDVGRVLRPEDYGYGEKCAAFATCLRPATRVGHFGCPVCEQCFEYGIETYGTSDAECQRLSERKRNRRVQREAVESSERKSFISTSNPLREWRGPGWLDPLTARSVAEAGATRGFWADCDWWYGRDGKYRPIGRGISPLIAGAAESSLLPMASGPTDYVGLLRNPGLQEIESSEARTQRLRGYGDAIVAQVAQAFVEAYIEHLTNISA